MNAPTQPVLYVLKRFPRLSETFVLHEILGLEAVGVRVLVDTLLPAEDGPTHPELAGVLAAVRYIPRHPRLSTRSVLATHAALASRHPVRWAALASQARRDGTWRRFVQAGLVAGRIRSESVGHVHAHFATAACEVATMAARLAGVTCSVTAHAKDIYHQDNAPHVARRLAGVDTVVTVSSHNVTHLTELLGVPVRPVPNRTPRRPVSGRPVRSRPVRSQPVRSRPVRSQPPRIRHIPNGVSLGPAADPTTSLRLLCVARLVPKKGVDLLVEAAALLVDRHPNLQVDIIGDGPLRDELCAQINRLGLADRVHLLGVATTSEVAAAMATSRAVVLPCRIDVDGDRDGMPTVLVEALACGVPVVSTDVVGIGELVADGETGLLVGPEDVTGLAGALDRLLVDPDLAARLGLAGRLLVRDRFRPQDSTAALVEVFAAARPATSTSATSTSATARPATARPATGEGALS